MNGIIEIVTVAAITGAGLVTGLLFAFSNFVMKSLADLSRENGMFAMQRINETIINPIFLFLFLGTPILCLIIAVYSGINLNKEGSWYLLAGAISYLAGPFGITLLFNVPLNNRLAAAEVSESESIWPEFQKNWQRWNHLRMIIGIISIVLISMGLAAVKY